MDTYEKKYKEALEWARKVMQGKVGFVLDEVLEKFPELREESEGERIRKGIIRNLEYLMDRAEGFVKDELKERIAWLEKQAEKKSYASETMNEKGDFDSGFTRMMEKEQKPAYTKEYDFHGIKFIPKFAKGDIIKDKKCGEVSTIEDFSYDTGLYTHTYGQFPITIQDNYEIIAQKPAWSKEDEKIIRRIDSLLYSQCKIHGSEYEEIHNWLKSLRPQNTWKPSDEQMKALKDALNDAICQYDFKGSLIKEEVTRKHAETIDTLYNDLQKLKEE